LLNQTRKTQLQNPEMTMSDVRHLDGIPGLGTNKSKIEEGLAALSRKLQNHEACSRDPESQPGNNNVG